MRPITAVVPAAGRSHRFSEAGIYQPKALIKFTLPGEERRPMLLQAIRGVELGRLIVGVGPASVDRFESELSGAVVVPIRDTRGQAETILQLLAHVPDGDFLVVNCDQGFADTVLHDFVAAARWAQLTEKNTSVAVLTFPATEDCYSYVDQAPWFKTAVEKRPISNYAIAGAYWFQSARQLAKAIVAGTRLWEARCIAAALHVNDRGDGVLDVPPGEIYLSECLEFLPDHRRALSMARADLLAWGTPGDLFGSTAEQLDVDVHEALMRWKSGEDARHHNP